MNYLNVSNGEAFRRVKEGEWTCDMFASWAIEHGKDYRKVGYAEGYQRGLYDAALATKELK
jgi:hypothetical protein